MTSQRKRGRWTLVTGQPGCGKTTLVKALLDGVLRKVPGLRVSGFYTDEVLKGGSRCGFDVVTVGGDRGVLSRKGGPASQPRTGAYSVDVGAFEALALPSIAPNGQDVVVIDEIGRMELHSARFRDAVQALLRSGVRVVGAITAPIYGHRVPFCDEVARCENVEVLRIKKSNRDATTARLRQQLENEYAANNNKAASGDAAAAKDGPEHRSRRKRKRA